MRSCLNRVRKFFGKTEQQQEQQQVEVIYMNNDSIVQHTNKNDKANKHNEVRYQSHNQDKFKKVATTELLTTSESHELLSKVDEPANAYIEEYKTFVEEKQQLLSASTPYTTAESFDFEQLFNQHSRRYSEVQALRLLRHAATDEHEYLAKVAAESDDVVTPLPSEQSSNPLRPVTLPRCYALPSELTEALRKLSEKSELESEMRQRQSKNVVKYLTEDDNEVILRRPMPPQYGNRTCSLFERRQPDCPKLKLCLKTTSGSFDAEVFTQNVKHSYEIPLFGIFAVNDFFTFRTFLHDGFAFCYWYFFGY